MGDDFAWPYQCSKLYGLIKPFRRTVYFKLTSMRKVGFIKLFTPEWARLMSLAAPFRNWCAECGYKVVELACKVGARFSGALLHVRQGSY